jgi:hypothetical protein
MNDRRLQRLDSGHRRLDHTQHRPEEVGHPCPIRRRSPDRHAVKRPPQRIAVADPGLCLAGPTRQHRDLVGAVANLDQAAVAWRGGDVAEPDGQLSAVKKQRRKLGAVDAAERS